MFRARTLLLGISLLFTALVAFGQARPSFEVASVKPAEALSANAVMSGQMHIGLTMDNAMVHCTSMSISDLLRYAYKVRTYQISGPEWLRTQRFNITAKLPEGANRDQVPEMVQTLLAERFKVALHRETTEQPVYALVVLKGGVKLKEAAPDPADPTPSNGPAAPQAPAPTDGSAQVRAEAVSNAAGGINMRSVNGDSKMTQSQNGNGMRVELTRMNITGMVEFLSRFIERPIIDATDLKSRYDLTLDIGLEDMLALARSAGVSVPFAPAGNGSASDPGTSTVFTGIQQYGLKLEPRKAPIDLLVIDHVEKLPTEN